VSQRKGARQKNKPPANQHSKNPTPKQDGWWATELISRTCGQHTNLNFCTSVREGLTMQLPLKDRRKAGKIPQPPGKTKIETLLNQGWMLKE
jgi:hypothetical protein